MPEKKVRVELPQLSVRGSGNPVLGKCQACDSVAMLAWDEKDLGEICRECATLLIGAELQLIFPKAKWKGGPQS
jgi:hypothetical protein